MTHESHLLEEPEDRLISGQDLCRKTLMALAKARGKISRGGDERAQKIREPDQDGELQDPKLRNMSALLHLRLTLTNFKQPCSIWLSAERQRSG